MSEFASLDPSLPHGLGLGLGGHLGVPAVVPGPRQCVLHGSVGPGIEYGCE